MRQWRTKFSILDCNWILYQGCVFESEYDLYQVHKVSRTLKLFCSEVMTWVNEYRIYVVHSEIRSINCYAGNAFISVDIKEVNRAIQILDKASESYAGYTIDFRVSASGQTALIEMNDGFAIGTYNIDNKNVSYAKPLS